MRTGLRVSTHAWIAAALLALAPAGYADEQTELDAALLAFQRGDVVDALQRYERLATTGSAEAMTQLGYIHDQSEANELAVRWYRQAAEKGYAAAQHGLGEMYAKGEGVAQDEPVARSWFIRAAEQGYAPSIRLLWTSAELGGLGQEADPTEALRWLRAGVQAGDVSSMQRLARAYRNAELGLEIDQHAATELETRSGSGN
jgi:TPR repeat protein